MAVVISGEMENQMKTVARALLIAIVGLTIAAAVTAQTRSSRRVPAVNGVYENFAVGAGLRMNGQLLKHRPAADFFR